MKIAIGSDIHLEFGPLPLDNQPEADVLVLAGDIVLADSMANTITSPYAKNPNYEKALSMHQFFKDCSERYENVIYVMGNHEHYHGTFNESESQLREATKHLKNFHFLETQAVELAGVLFVGATLWTDMNKGDPMTKHVAESGMNDFAIVKFRLDEKTRRRLQANDVIRAHKASLKFFKEAIDNTTAERVVVVSHHGPTFKSVHPRYAADALMNGAYCSDLSEFILDRPKVKLWFHGHTHTEHDYEVGATRVVCYPRGYVNHERGTQEEEPYFFKTVDV